MSFYDGTKNRRLIQILGNLREQMYRFRIEYLKEREIRQSLVVEHQAIMAAIEQRDEAAAVKLMAEHIDNQQKAIYASLALSEA